MQPTPRPLEPGFEQEFATQLIGADTLFGGDIGLPEGAAHFIADSYPKAEVTLPEIYRDVLAKTLRQAGGAAPACVETVRTLVDAYDLLDARDRLLESLGPDCPPLRRQFVENMGNALGIITRTALAIAENGALPSYEERFRAVAKRDPELADTQELRDQLRKALEGVDINVPAGRDLREAFLEWEQRVGSVPPEQFAEHVHNVNRLLMEAVRQRIFNEIDFGIDGHDLHLEDVPFDGLTLKTVSGVSYTGSSAYEGGVTDDGKPALRDLIEYNIDHPVNPAGLWHLCSHEMKPGHYIDSAVADLRWRGGQLGIEGVAHTMCTPETVMREGWAQNALAMAFGGDEENVIRALGPHQAVQYLAERMQDAGKNNASVLFQLQGRPIEEVQEHLRNACVLPDAYVKKLSGAWATHRIMGPMYGPAYRVGYDVVRKAIGKYGPAPVAKAALHGFGFTDIQTFEMALEGVR